MNVPELHTERLRMIPATAALLRLELDNPAAFAAQIHTALPEDWPPGEYDRDAIQFFLEQTISGGSRTAGWYSWYVLLDMKEHGCQLIGGGGYMGAPDEDGQVEIGYSLCQKWRGQGLAKEMAGALVENAWRRGARTVTAHTDADNAASIAVLRACGFQPQPDETSQTRLFVRHRAVSS